MQLDLIITNAYVVTVDAARRVLDPGHVGVADGRIVLVGAGAPPADVDAAVVVDARGGVCHPGLIDTHAHVAWGVVRCAVPEDFTEEEVFRLFDERMLARVREEDEHVGTLLSCVEMAMNGTTCFADTGSALHDLAPTAEAVELVGIRGMISTLNADAVPAVPALDLPLERCLARAQDAVERYPRDGGLAWACVGLLGMEATTDALVREGKALADAAGVPLNLHKSFGADEVAECRARLGGRDPLAGFEELGVLDPNLLLVHVNVLTAEEAALVRAERPCLCHCPTASMTYGIGGSHRGRFPELVEAGATVALGTDSVHWGNAWDLMRSVYLAATLHKEATGVRPSIGAERALEMATLHGARAVGRADELGSLEPGKRADLVLHGVDRPETHPRLDPLANLVFAAGSRSVDRVWVEGREVVRDGRPTRVDLEGLLARVDRQADALSGVLGYRPPRRGEPRDAAASADPRRISP